MKTPPKTPPGNPGFDAEDFSAWLDSEHPVPPEILDRILDEPGLREKWCHYHLIGDCLAGRYREAQATPATARVRLAPRPRALQAPLGIAAAAVISVTLAAAAALLWPRQEPATLPVAVTPPPGNGPAPMAQQCRGEGCVTPLRGVGGLQSAAEQRLASYLVGHSELAAAGTPDVALAYVRIMAQAPHGE